MNAFPVLIRPMGNNCLLRVEGIKNAQWLLDRLSRSFVFKTSDPMDKEQSSSRWVFRVAYSSQMYRRGLEKLLVGIPEVNLMTELV